ncbi:MAG: hypothetical protein ACK5Y2_04860 [Bdellovibrionales bacterium]
MRRRSYFYQILVLGLASLSLGCSVVFTEAPLMCPTLKPTLQECDLANSSCALNPNAHTCEARNMICFWKICLQGGGLQ